MMKQEAPRTSERDPAVRWGERAADVTGTAQNLPAAENFPAVCNFSPCCARQFSKCLALNEVATVAEPSRRSRDGVTALCGWTIHNQRRIPGLARDTFATRVPLSLLTPN